MATTPSSFALLLCSLCLLVVEMSRNGLGCVERERDALLHFKHALVDDYALLNSTTDCCRWRGIRCSNLTGHVTMLSLSALWLSGEISASVLELQHLTHLDLSFNDGLWSSENNLDWLSHLSSLRHLDLGDVDLSKAGIHWPQAIHKLPSLFHLSLTDCSLPPFSLSSNSPVNTCAPLAFLDLSSNDFDITSSIYPWLFNFSTTLLHLDLSWNGGGLNGSIPEAFGNMMRSLVYLDLSNNQLQGSIPDTLGTLASLELLYLAGNRLQGEIPNSLSNLCHLQELDLGGNNLSGQLSQVFDVLVCANNTLETVDLSQNQLRGSIPHLIGFSSLRELDLGDNKLNGTLPTSIGQLKKLESLQGVVSEAHFLHLSQLNGLILSDNSLTFNISSEWVPPFNLMYLVLASCRLGPRFPTWLRTQRNLKSLDISNSKISNVIPNWFWNLTSSVIYFNISNNQLRGILPNLSSKFDTPFYIDMSSNDLGGLVPQLPSNLILLYLSNNKFSGSISSICTVPYLVHVDLSNNLLSGELPNCWSQLIHLRILNLENNDFSGNIPDSFGSLQWIQSLHLRNNNLIGELPSSLRKCQNLSFIDLAKNRLSGKILPWIGESLINLMVLNIRSNNFSGSICPELCQLKKIQILDLSDNNIVGNIPRCISNFTSMIEKGNLTVTYGYNDLMGRGMVISFWSYDDMELVKWKGREFEYKNTLGLVKSIDLSSNKLTGEIPKEVTELIELVSLNFSRNNLTGLIPATIGRLKSLDVLDLSQNQLTGEIPTSLSEIYDLSTLNLSSNNLSGEIPRATQLQSFNPSCYEGNPGLCGLPLTKKCSGGIVEEVPKANNSHHEGNNNQQNEQDIWLVVRIALGFIVGFWGVCGSLLLNNSWRYAYFRFLDEIKDWIYVNATVNINLMRRSLQN